MKVSFPIPVQLRYWEGIHHPGLSGHKGCEKIKSKEAFIDKAEKEGKISPELAEMERLSLLRKKARLSTAAGLGSVGLSWDKLGDIGKKFDNTMALA